jgi:hypothetical protein
VAEPPVRAVRQLQRDGEAGRYLKETAGRVRRPGSKVWDLQHRMK